MSGPPDGDFPGGSADLSASDDALILRTARLALRIERASGRLSLSDPEGRQFCADAGGLEWSRPDGAHVRCTKRIEEGEHFYGFGERSGLLAEAVEAPW